MVWPDLAGIIDPFALVRQRWESKPRARGIALSPVGSKGPAAGCADDGSTPSQFWCQRWTEHLFWVVQPTSERIWHVGMAGRAQQGLLANECVQSDVEKNTWKPTAAKHRTSLMILTLAGSSGAVGGCQLNQRVRAHRTGLDLNPFQGIWR